MHQSCLDHWDIASLRSSGLLWLELECQVHSIAIAGPTQVAALIAAEKALVGPGHKVQILRENQILPPHALLRPNTQAQPYQLHHLCKNARKGALQDARNVIGTSDITVWTGLLRLQAAFPSEQCFVVPPNRATFMASSCSGLDQQIEWPAFAKCCLLAFVDHGHWSLLVLSRGQSGVQAVHYDGIPGRSTAAAQQLAGNFCSLYQCPLVSFESRCHWQQQGPNDCGAIALAHAAVALTQSTPRQASTGHPQ